MLRVLIPCVLAAGCSAPCDALFRLDGPAHDEIPFAWELWKVRLDRADGASLRCFPVGEGSEPGACAVAENGVLDTSGFQVRWRVPLAPPPGRGTEEIEVRWQRDEIPLRTDALTIDWDADTIEPQGEVLASCVDDTDTDG